MLFITRPNYDDTTNYLYYWSEEIIKEAEKRNIKVIDFKGKKANRVDIEKFLKKQNPKFIIFNGHGSAESIYGQKEIIIKSGENEKLLKSKIIYAISCNSASKLGEDSIKAGAESYMGYGDAFIFLYDPNKCSNPLSDDLAKPFLKPSNELAISILKKNTTEEAYIKSQNSFKKEIRNLALGESTNKEAIRWLIWDMHCQKLLGNPKAQL